MHAVLISNFPLGNLGAYLYCNKIMEIAMINKITVENNPDIICNEDMGTDVTIIFSIVNEYRPFFCRAIREL